MKRFIVFKSKFSARWDWTLKAENGNVLARSAQSFASKRGASENATTTYLELGYAVDRGELKCLNTHR